MTVSLRRRRHHLFLIIAMIATALLFTGCEHSEGTVIIEDDTGPACTGLVEGTAFFPYYEGDAVPVYYADENHDIIVTLYDEFDHIVSDEVTDPSGFYAFDHLPPGYYFMTAQAEAYLAEADAFEIYVAETPLFRVGDCEWIDEQNLFLEYSHTEY